MQKREAHFDSLSEINNTRVTLEKMIGQTSNVNGQMTMNNSNLWVRNYLLKYGLSSSMLNRIVNYRQSKMAISLDAKMKKIIEKWKSESYIDRLLNRNTFLLNEMQQKEEGEFVKGMKLGGTDIFFTDSGMGMTDHDLLTQFIHNHVKRKRNGNTVSTRPNYFFFS